MVSSKSISRQWITIGAISGITANFLFPILILTSLSDGIELFLAALFGISFSLTGFGIHHLLKQEENSVLSQIGSLFIFAAGVMFNLMIMVQLTFRGYLNQFREGTTDPSDIDLLNWITRTVDPVHLGVQLTTDFFTGLGIILFSIVMLDSKFFGKIWSISGFLIGFSLILVKCYSFPNTPYEIGFPYIFGPLISLWFLSVCIQCLRENKRLGAVHTLPNQN